MSDALPESCCPRLGESDSGDGDGHDEDTAPSSLAYYDDHLGQHVRCQEQHMAKAVTRSVWL